MTYREVINSVLRRLRETTIPSDWSGDLNDSTASTISDYHKLIGEFVNEAKREVEDAWNWSILRSSPTVTTVADTQAYTITGTNERTRILMAQEQSNGTILQEMSDPYLQFTKYPTSAVQKTLPSYYSITGVDSTGPLTVEFDPVPDAAYNITFRVVNPQEDLTEAATVLKIPNNIVVLGAWARAISERGEDGGSLSDMVFGQYQQALGDAIAIDAGRASLETTWYAA